MPNNDRRFCLFSRDVPKKIMLLNSESAAIEKAKASPTLDIVQVPTEVKTPDKYGRERRVDPVTGAVFVKLLHSTSGELFIEETPVKADTPNQREILFKDISSITQLKTEHPELFAGLREESFSFTVTPETIRRRYGAKRPRSQTEVMGETARNVLTNSGAELETGTEIHWAHRCAWSLGGSQTEDNLDVGTAGSNYSTLLLFESPLKHLVAQEGVSEVNVKGTAYFHPLVEVPFEIRYELTWGNGRKVSGSTYPLELRKPSRVEFSAACTLFAVTRTPRQPQTTVPSSTELAESEVIRALTF